MIPVRQALDRILDLVSPTETETVALGSAAGRVLAGDLTAPRDQPPHATSAMDGYALLEEDAQPGAALEVIGEAAAGRPFAGRVRRGTAVRIFTGAVVPDGAQRVVIQEDVYAVGTRINVRDGIDLNRHVRPAGGDYRAGLRITSPRPLRPSTVSLIASMNIAEVPVFRRPDVAIIPSGDELAMPGDPQAHEMTIASSGFGIAAILDAAGASCRILPIARDRIDSIESTFRTAQGADLTVTIGGASEGDYDLIRPTAERMGLRQSFYKLAMRPGKPLMAGSIHGRPVVGLPGNPVSALVCSHVFLVPAVRALLGLGRSELPRKRAPLAAPASANGIREHYMRAKFDRSESELRLRILERQDSSLMSVLDEADALAVRPPGDPPRAAGDVVEYIDLADPMI